MTVLPPPSSRAKILDVAEALFAARGYSGVGLRAVAAAAGLGKSSLFHHFPTKAALYLEVLERVLLRIAVSLSPALEASGGPADRLERWLVALIDALADQPASARLLLRGLFEDEDFPAESQPDAARVEQTVMSILGGFESILTQGISEGVFRPVSSVDAIQTVIGISVYHFASGELGEAVIGGSLFSSQAVQRRRREVVGFLRRALSPMDA